MKKLCVGIDIAKDKFDVCFTVDSEKYFGHTVFSNSNHGLKDLVTLSKKYKKEFKADKIHFCMEATGIYHYELCEYLQKYSALIVSVVNPHQTKSFAKSLLLRNIFVDDIKMTILFSRIDFFVLSKALQHFR